MINLDDLDGLTELIQTEFEAVSDVRNQAYERSRRLVSVCAKAIRAVHREEWQTAETLIARAKRAADTLVNDTQAYPAIYYAGYSQDALKEYVEANLTYALVRNRPLPTPEELSAEANTWLNGLAEATTELRRRILDIIRHGHSEEAERLLDVMDQVYSTLVTFDFSDSITGGLRRRTDTVRAVLERTRGDVTTSLRQTELETALEALEQRLGKIEG